MQIQTIFFEQVDVSNPNCKIPSTRSCCIRSGWIRSRETVCEGPSMPRWPLFGSRISFERLLRSCSNPRDDTPSMDVFHADASAHANSACQRPGQMQRYRIHVLLRPFFDAILGFVPPRATCCLHAPKSALDATNQKRFALDATNPVRSMSRHIVPSASLMGTGLHVNLRTDTCTDIRIDKPVSTDGFL